MKKIMIVIFGGTFLFAGCRKTTPDSQQQTDAPAVLDAHVVRCSSQEVLAEQLKTDPGLKARMEAIERFQLRMAAEPEARRLLANGTIEIPVVVNVLYRTATENISLAQIRSQIDVLNEDYKALNPDYNNTPTVFKPLRSGSFGISFVLDTVIRKQTTKTVWSDNDAMKKSSQGGINPTSPTTRLNLWVVNNLTSTQGQLLGYAQFPGGSSATDGVVIGYYCFGRTGTAVAPFNKGRTATHEIGHWLNLKHIWGDDYGSCSGSDLVGDTPNQGDENYGMPSFPQVSCSNGPNGDLFMNYMDYVDDAAMFMFTAGQKTRAMATFASGGGRSSFAQ